MTYIKVAIALCAVFTVWLAVDRYIAAMQYKGLYEASKLALEVQITHTKRVEAALADHAQAIAKQVVDEKQVRRSLTEVIQNEENRTICGADLPDDVVRLLRGEDPACERGKGVPGTPAGSNP